MKRVGRELGVRYVLEGSVRGGRAAAYWHATDRHGNGRASVGRPLRRVFRDVFELQDKVASSVAGAIEPVLQAAETTVTRPFDERSQRL